MYVSTKVRFWAILQIPMSNNIAEFYTKFRNGRIKEIPLKEHIIVYKSRANLAFGVVVSNT